MKSNGFKYVPGENKWYRGSYSISNNDLLERIRYMSLERVVERILIYAFPNEFY